MSLNIPLALTFDDVLIQPRYSEVTPNLVNTSIVLSDNISLTIPVISAAMDTVTERKMAIALAQHGGIGCIHKNMSIKDQVMEVVKVKKFESSMVDQPVTIHPDMPLSGAINIMKSHSISGLPVVNDEHILVGVLTNRDVRYADDLNLPVSHYMTKDNLIVVKPDVSLSEAKRLFRIHKIERLIIVDDTGHCVGLMTVKDINESEKFPNAARDARGRLLVAAAVGVTPADKERLDALVQADTDMIIIDTAHGHSKGVIDMVKFARETYGKKICIVAGNIATPEAARALIEAGVDLIKVGIGPGSICTTRIVAGVGVPQLSAIIECVNIARSYKIPVIADGGIRTSGDIAKAIGAGASAVMLGSIFAGTHEAPGKMVFHMGKSYKIYRGMGSHSAMQLGSAERYFQDPSKEPSKLVAEGIEGRVPYKGMVSDVIYQLVGGLRSAMGYTGSPTIAEMQRNCEFVRITNSGLVESYPHNIDVISSFSNYEVTS